MKVWGQCGWNAARRCLQIIHQARDNHLHTHPPATHICGACWLCRWKGNASIGIAHLPHNALRGHVPVPNECHGKAGAMSRRKFRTMRADSYKEMLGQCWLNAVRKALIKTKPGLMKSESRQTSAAVRNNPVCHPMNRHSAR